MNEGPLKAARAKEKYCCVRVYDGTFRGHLCHKPPKVEAKGKWYCAIHDPETVKRKDEIKHARWEAESQQRMAKWRLEQAAAEMLALLIESQTSIGGDWRERRDAIILKATSSQATEGSGS